MPSLFDPLKLGPITLPNRIVMAPMTRSRNDDNGVPTEIMTTYYAQRASAGLIISEAIYISPGSKGYSRIPGLHSQAQVAGWKKITDAVHAAGGRIFAQLVHCGRVCVPELLPPGVEPVAPSAIAIKGKNYSDFGPIDFVVPRALETSEIAGIVGDFASAAKNAIAAGFDGVELHAASGYLAHQFLDGSINQRTDAYGESAENRIRFVTEVIDALVAAVGRERVGIKVSPGIKFNDVKDPDAEIVYPLLAKALSARKIAYLHGAKQGAWDVHAGMRPLFEGAYFAGSGLDQANGAAMLQSGAADAIVYGTLFVSNPDLPHRFEAGLPLTPGDSKTHYSKGPEGYIDYAAAAG
jgi:N-ethylmaleimide reductase